MSRFPKDRGTESSRMRMLEKLEAFLEGGGGRGGGLGFRGLGV